MTMNNLSKQRKQKNMALLIALTGLVVLFFGISMVKFAL